uniref:EOG090X07TK n=1 Tax=Alona affinis TaxID=381656 RepID=A0A9N6WS24_9CRUS|nr:EOG090X07TK [Alona affinis]
MSEVNSSTEKDQEANSSTDKGCIPSSSCPILEDSGTDGEEDQGVTLVEVLEEQAQLEEDADAVLGGSDDKNCTYSLGYVKRQALYACITCMKNSNGKTQLAGVCLACSLDCHSSHEMVELYTKRNFCCDCGNSKFPSKCSLNPEKSEVNDKNHYNHNFNGLYCTCLKPYPDPHDTNPDDMVQCVICEDWLHGKHLGKAPPSDSDYSEMICDGCMTKHDFLSAYVDEPAVQVTDDAGKEKDSCQLEQWKKKDTTALVQATYWPEGWRQRLCRCTKCLEMYSTKKLEFLLDEQDTVEWYEQKGKSAGINRPSHNDQMMAALSSLDRIQQVEAITEYQSMSNELKEYLKKFADSKKVVRSEDITEFFSKLKERKRQKEEKKNTRFSPK